MPSKEEIQRRKALARQMQQGEDAKFIAGLPIGIKQFQTLFDYLDERLTENDCDHSLRLTRQFAMEAGLPVELLETWLAKHGGYCDCEVLANVEEQFEGIE